MKLLSKLALAWMFAWLPLSGVVAATMPFCAQGMGGLVKAGMVADGGDVMPCHEVEGNPKTADSTGTVEHCDLCHIACAFVPPALPVVANAAPGVAPVDATVSDFRSWIPDPLQHPPLPSPD